MPVDLPAPTPELGAWLEENREPLIRRWLELVVERSTLEQLASRPLAERVQELDLLLEAARASESGESTAVAAGGVDELDVIGAALVAQASTGAPFALALIAPPDGGIERGEWIAATIQSARRDERVTAAPGGLVAVVIPVDDPGRARNEADRLRAGAWQLLGGACALPDVGVAMHPADAADAAGLFAAARSRLPREPDVADERIGGDDRPPADVTPLYPVPRD